MHALHTIEYLAPPTLYILLHLYVLSIYRYTFFYVLYPLGVLVSVLSLLIPLSLPSFPPLISLSLFHSHSSYLCNPCAQGEMMLYFASLPVIWARGQWNYSLPNAANISFNFYYFLVITMLLYIPCEHICFRYSGFVPPSNHHHCVINFIVGFFSVIVVPQLYGHMIKQRRKIIGGVVTVDSSKKTN